MAERLDQAIGLIRLDTSFPRPVGDLGRADSYPVRVLTQVVSGALPSEVVSPAEALRSSSLVPRFVEAACALYRQGATSITTSCGFLVLLQDRLQAAVPVPVLSSSLLALPELLRHEPVVGVLTFDDRRLGREHLLAAGVPEARLGNVWVQGLPQDSHLVQVILGRQAELDRARARAEVVAAALALQARAPALSTLVLECTNLPPYAQALVRATGWRLVTLLQSRRLLGAQAVEASWLPTWG